MMAEVTTPDMTELEAVSDAADLALRALRFFDADSGIQFVELDTDEILRVEVRKVSREEMEREQAEKATVPNG